MKSSFKLDLIKKRTHWCTRGSWAPESPPCDRTLSDCSSYSSSSSSWTPSRRNRSPPPRKTTQRKNPRRIWRREASGTGALRLRRGYPARRGPYGWGYDIAAERSPWHREQERERVKAKRTIAECLLRPWCVHRWRAFYPQTTTSCFCFCFGVL